jgi:MoaA/NifB/PqqE/SkfB family radical SAM enzyme
MIQYSKEMKGKMLSITAVLNRKTYRDMIELAKFVHAHFDVYNLYFSNYKGENVDMAFTDAEIEDMFSNYIPKVKDFFRETGNEYSLRQLNLYNPSDFIAQPDRFQQNSIIPCYIQLSEMTIDVDGSCHNCSHNFRDGYKPYNVNANEKSLKECFEELKAKLEGNWTNISKHCQSGCNCNLMGFNRAVHKGELI